MKSRSNKRDPAIELARIIGCLIVIGVHTLIGYEHEDGWDTSLLFLGMIFADGVAIFWVITGAFLYNNTNYKRLLAKQIKAIIIPMTIIGTLYFYLGNWILGYSSFWESINHTKEDYFKVFHNLIRWENGIGGLPHFWYLFVYLFLVLLFPVLKSFVDYLDSSKNRIIVFMIVSFVLIVINDITYNELFGFSHHSINGVVPAAIYSIWGHIIYNNRDKLKIRYAIYSLFLFFLANFIRLLIQIDRVNDGNLNKSIMSWSSSFGLICSICVVCFCICIMKDRKKGVSIINYIASYTMAIYLIHWVVKDYIFLKGVASFLLSELCGRFKGFLGECLFSVAIITVFSMCFIMIFLYRVIVKLLKNIMGCKND